MKFDNPQDLVVGELALYQRCAPNPREVILTKVIEVNTNRYVFTSVLPHLKYKRVVLNRKPSCNCKWKRI